MGARSAVKSAYNDELPLRQFIPDSKPTTINKSRVNVNESNPAAIFCDAGVSSCLTPPYYRITPAQRKVSGRSDTVSSSARKPVAGQTAAARQRSPWRPANIKPAVLHSDHEVGRNGRLKRCPSVSSEAQRRPADRIRAASAPRVRRTRSVPVTSTTPTDRRDDRNDILQTSLNTETSDRSGGRSHSETWPAERFQSRLPRPVVPVHSIKQTPDTVGDKPTPSKVGLIAKSMKSAWEKVLKVGDLSTKGGFLPVLIALLFVIIAVIVGCVFTYLNAKSSPSSSQASSEQILQPLHETPVSSSKPSSIWSWLHYIHVV